MCVRPFNSYCKQITLISAYLHDETLLSIWPHTDLPNYIAYLLHVGKYICILTLFISGTILSVILFYDK